MRKWITLMMLLPITVLANRPLYQAWVTLDDVQVVSSGVWRVKGNVMDYSALGYTAHDTAAGNLIFAQSDAGVVDMYRVVSVGTTTAQRITVDVTAATNAWPVSDAPGTGKQIICAVSNNAVFLPSFTANQADEYLVRQAQNLTGFILGMGGSSVVQTNFPYTAITNAPWLTSSSTASNSDLLDGQHGTYYIGLTNSIASTGYVATATAGMVTGTPWASVGYLTNLMGAMTNLVLTTNAPSGTTFANGTLNLGTNASSSGGSSYGFLNTNANMGVYTSGTNVLVGTNSPWIFGTGRVWLTDSGGTSTLYHITSGNVTNLIGSFTGL